MQRDLVAPIRDAVEYEIPYVEDRLLEGVFGLDAGLFRDYVQFIAGRRLLWSRLPLQYGSRNLFPWMSETIDLPKEKNFFGTRVTEYQRAASLVQDK